jgi:putative peptidoglycan lipid II flippase
MPGAKQDSVEPGGRIFPSFAAITFFTFINAIINYLTYSILAYFFGAGSEIDAFFAATTLPLVILAILQVIIPNTFIPEFIRIKKRDEAHSWRIASIATNLLFVLLALLAVIGVVFAAKIIPLLNPGLAPATAALSASLFPYFILSAVFSGTAVILSSMHYAQKRFIRPLLAQLLSSSVILVFVLLFHGRFGIQSIAMGTLAGAILQLLFLHSVLLGKRRWSPSLDFRSKEIAVLLALMLPLLLSSVFSKTTLVVERFITSRLPGGSVALIGYAGRINAALILFLAQGAAIAIFQRQSEHSANLDLPGLNENLSRSLRAMILLATPFVLLLVLAGNDLVRLVFQRGSFTPQATQAVGAILLAYLGFLVVSTVGVPVVTALYSLQLTTIVSAVGVGGFVLYSFLALVFSRRLGCQGIALAASVQSLVSISCFLVIVAGKIGRLRWAPIGRCIGKAVLAAAAAVVVSVALKALMRGHLGPNLEFVVSALAAFGVYAGMLVALRTAELAFISARLLRRR